MPGGRPSRDDVIDAILAAVLAAISVASVLTPDTGAVYRFRAPGAGLVLLALLNALPFAARRRLPFTVGITVVAATVAIAALRWNTGIGPFLVLFALATIGYGAGLRAALAGLGLTYAGLALLLVLRVPYFDHPLDALFYPFATAAWLVGRWMRRRRAERERAVAHAVAAQRLRAIEAERAVLAERLHIARELHDVVSHTLTVIAVRAGSDRHRLARDGAESPALAAIESTARVALEDLRRMLGPLRVAAPPGEFDPPPARAAAPRRLVNGPVDVLVAAAFAALGVGMAFVRDPALAYAFARPDALAVGLIAAAGLALAVRRRWPLPVLAVCSIATVVTRLRGADADWPGLAAYLALYTVAAWRRWPVALAGLGLEAATQLVLGLSGVSHISPLGDFAGAVVAGTLGLAVRRWRQQRDRELTRALEAERTRAAATERAVFAERLRIAGELHDVVAHALSAVAVQAAVARHQLGGRPGPTAETLDVIAEAGRRALDDLRRMLGILRDDDQAASLSPTPGLDELAVLASSHRAVDGPVELTVDAAVRAAPASVQLTVVRLVQEALTNVRKHAPGTAVRVCVGAAGRDIMVSVDNEEPATAGPRPGPGGFGLAGMRERVALFGGRFTAAPGAGGGFGVHAVLPSVLEPA